MFSATRTWVTSASAVTEMNMLTAMTPRRSSVRAAFSLFGGLNAGTPLLIASTPVSAVHPDENARSTRNTLASPPKADSALIPKPALSAGAIEPVPAWKRATRTSAPTMAMNAYVGSAKAVPDSRTPRRFIRASTATTHTEIATLWLDRLVAADVMLATPALTDTATVRT